MTAYLACNLSVAGDVTQLHLSGCSPEETKQILETLQRSHHILITQYAPGKDRWRSTLEE